MKKYVVFDIETTGLRPLYGDMITCICAKTSEGRCFSEYAMHRIRELDLIQKFKEWLGPYINKGYILITKNGTDFDIPFIINRSSDNAPNYHLLVASHFDVQEITTRRISLDTMAEMFCIPKKSGTGLNAIKLFKEGKYSELKKYCMNDVEITEQVYLKYQKFKRGKK